MQLVTAPTVKSAGLRALGARVDFAGGGLDLIAPSAYLSRIDLACRILFPAMLRFRRSSLSQSMITCAVRVSGRLPMFEC